MGISSTDSLKERKREQGRALHTSAIPPRAQARGFPLNRMKSRKKVSAASLPVHGAPFPLGLAKFLVQFLSRPGDLVLDIFSGWNTTGLVCELTGRRWLAFEKHAQYAAGGSFRFESFEGFERGFELQAST